jgi:hypothetical protein
VDHNTSAGQSLYKNPLWARKLLVLTFLKLIESQYITQFFCLKQSKSLYGPFAKSLQAKNGHPWSSG